MRSVRNRFDRVFRSVNRGAGSRAGTIGRASPRAAWHAAVLVLTVACLIASAADAESTLDRLANVWSSVRDYSITIEAHEVLGSRSEDRELRYAFRKPALARLDLVSGTKSVATILWRGGDTVVAYRRGLSFFKIRGNIHDHRFTSLRGNGILTPNLGDILACFERHKEAIDERRGPVIDGEPTDELALTRAHFQCASDPSADAQVTLDVIDVSHRGVILMRKRYEGANLVESWRLRDYQLNAGLPDDMFQ